MEDVAGTIIIILGIIALVVVCVFAFGALTMWAWNVVLAGLFHWPALNIWGGIAVNILAGIIARVTTIKIKK